MQDEELLVAVLNSAPIEDGTRTEELDGAAGRELALRFGGTGSPAELRRLRELRDALHRVVRDHDDPADALGPLLADAVLTPTVTSGGIRWEPRTSPDDRLAVRTAMAWSAVTEELPGRLRACANTACNLFLLDHSRPGTAKWCSMAACGNRAKARAHASRRRSS
nr:CGNR zinc finger domain-containing protein [Patulibacter americanus]